MNELDKAKIKKLQVSVKKLTQENKDILSIQKEMQVSIDWLRHQMKTGLEDVIVRVAKENIEFEVSDIKSTDQLIKEEYDHINNMA